MVAGTSGRSSVTGTSAESMVAGTPPPGGTERSRALVGAPTTQAPQRSEERSEARRHERAGAFWLLLTETPHEKSGAVSSRFEHSLGVFHRARRVFRNLRSQDRFAGDAPASKLDRVEDTLTIDVDRLDYIIRDSQMTGAEVLSVDTDRMIDAYTTVPEEGLALRDKAL